MKPLGLGNFTLSDSGTSITGSLGLTNSDNAYKDYQSYLKGLRYTSHYIKSDSEGEIRKSLLEVVTESYKEAFNQIENK